MKVINVGLSILISMGLAISPIHANDIDAAGQTEENVNDNVTSDNGKEMNNDTSSSESNDVAAAPESEVVSYKVLTRDGNMSYEVDADGTKHIQLKVVKVYADGHEEETTDYTYYLMNKDNRLTVTNQNGNIDIYEDQSGVLNELTVSCDSFESAGLDFSIAVDGQYESLHLDFVNPHITTINVTFDAKEGSFSDGSKTKVVKSKAGEVPSYEYPQPPKGMHFDGWVDANGKDAWNCDTLKDITLYAKYVPIESVVYVNTADYTNYYNVDVNVPQKVKLQVSRETENGSAEVVTDYTYKMIQKSDNDLLVTNAAGTVEMNAEQSGKNNELTITRTSKGYKSFTLEITVGKYTQTIQLIFDGIKDIPITFDANGGSFDGGSSQETLMTEKGESIWAALPQAPEGKVFEGWYTKDGLSLSDFDFSKAETFYAKYVQGIQFTFDAGDGLFSDNQKQHTILIASGTYPGHEIPTPPKGYVFDKWVDENGNDISQGDYTKDTTYYAVYTEAITVTLNPNGGTGNPIVEEAGKGLYYSFNAYREYFTHPNGKMLIGFRNDETGEVYSLDQSFTVGNKPVSLSAVWADPITLTFNCNGGFSGKGETFTEVVGKGQRLTYSSGIHVMPTKDGWIFNGWRKGSLDGEKVQPYNAIFNEDTVLYASYAKPVKLTFDNSAAGMDTRVVTIPEKEEVQLSTYDSIYLPEEKELVGYKVKGTDRIIKMYDYVTFDKDTEFELVIQDKLKVTYDSNGAGFEAKTEYVSKDTTYFSIYNVFEKAPEGKAFAGWALGSVDGPVLKTSHSELPFSTDTTLYAVWKDGYKVDLDLGQGVEGFMSSGPVFEKGSIFNTQIVNINESPKGKILVGWRINDNPKVIDKFSTFTINKDITLHAVWEDAITVTVRDPETKDVLYKSEIQKGKEFGDNYRVNDFIPRGKALKGWTLDSSTNKEIDVSTTTFEKDTDLYPIYENSLKVTLDWGKDGGSGYLDMNNANTFEVAKGQTYGFSFKILSSPKGKKLAGWQVGDTKDIIAINHTNENDGTALNGYVFNEDVTLHAVWKENVKVTFDANGQAFETGQEKIDMDLIKNQSYVAGQFPLVRNNVDKTKVVTGWRVNSPNGPLLKDDYYYAFDADTTYYAVWSDAVKVGFEYKGILFAQYTQSETFDDTIQNIIRNPIYIVDLEDDVLFEGWFNKETGEKLTKDTKFTKDCVFEARTVKKSITVTLDYNGGKGELKEVKPIGGYVYTSMLMNPYFEAPANKEFLGWSLEKDGELLDKSTYYIMHFKEDTTLYAKYADQITLTVHDEDKVSTYKAPVNTDLIFAYGSSYVVDGKTYYAGQHITFTKDTEIYRTKETFRTNVLVFNGVGENGFGLGPIGMDGNPFSRWDANIYVISAEPGKKYVLELDDRYIPEGMVFDKWVSSKDVVFENPTSKKTYFTMPETYLGGSLNIYATYKEGTPLQFEKDTVELGKGQRAQLKVKGDYDTLTWSSSDPTTVQVDQSGHVHAVRSGQATISATDTSGNKITCVVKVSNKLKSISLSDTKLTLSAKTEKKLTVTLTPSDADDEKLTWTSSNEDVVKVNKNGTLTTVSCGEATITVKTESGLKDTCVVTVKHDFKVKSRTEATTEKEGKIVYECSLCKKIKEETIPRITGTWKTDSKGTKFVYTDGTFEKSGFKKIEDKTYYFLETGYVKTGSLQKEGAWYYFDEKGVMQTSKWIDNYYYEEDGKMATSKWIGDRYVDANGRHTPDKWVESNGKYWYRHQDGSYTKNDFEVIQGQTYYFDANGYMVNGWKQVGSDWYYFNKAGHMVKNQWINNYYFEADGKMATNKWIGNYYVDSNGLYTPDQWVLTNGKYWYRHQDGSYTKNDFEVIAGQTYYFDSNGYMVNGWKQVGKDWYYFTKAGHMAKNQWIQNYYFGSDGKMATNKWIGDSYVGPDGKWIPDYKK